MNLQIKQVTLPCHLRSRRFWRMKTIEAYWKVGCLLKRAKYGAFCSELLEMVSRLQLFTSNVMTKGLLSPLWKVEKTFLEASRKNRGQTQVSFLISILLWPLLIVNLRIRGSIWLGTVYSIQNNTTIILPGDTRRTTRKLPCRTPSTHFCWKLIVDSIHFLALF